MPICWPKVTGRPNNECQRAMSLGIDDSSLRGVLQQGTSLVYQCRQSLAMHRDLENLCLWNERRGGSSSLTNFTYLPSCNHLNIQGGQLILLPALWSACSYGQPGTQAESRPTAHRSGSPGDPL